MITDISHKLAIFLNKHSEQENDVDYLRYGIELLLGGLLKVISLFFVSYILDIVQPMIWAFLTFALLRSLTGGHHYSTYFRCLFAGLIMFNGLAYLSIILNRLNFFQTSSYFLYFATILGLYLAYIYAPSNHFYKKFTESQNKKLRMLSFLTIGFWFLFMQYLIVISYSNEIILASILGFLFQLCSLHPYTYKIVDKIEALIERR